MYWFRDWQSGCEICGRISRKELTMEWFIYLWITIFLSILSAGFGGYEYFLPFFWY